MDLPPLTYLSVDPMSSGVGASQVLPYVEGLSRRGVEVTLHSMEKGMPSRRTAERLEEARVRWRPHPWGLDGSMGGLIRMARGAGYLRGSELVHARSDIPAASALLARPSAWVWDVRGFWADERIEMGLMRPGSPQERILRAVERGAARRAGAIVTLTAAAISVLAARHGSQVRDKTRVITTCVDLGRFAALPMQQDDPVKLLLAGTVNRRYNVPLMLRLASELRKRRPTQLVALLPAISPWEPDLRAAGIIPAEADPAEMPGRIVGAHAGLAVLHQGGVAQAASMPTKIAEFLACGRPVVVNGDLGDSARLLPARGCGVVIGGSSEADLATAADALCELISDPETPHRCRMLAESHFDLSRGITNLMLQYRQALERPL